MSKVIVKKIIENIVKKRGQQKDYYKQMTSIMNNHTPHLWAKNQKTSLYSDIIDNFGINLADLGLDLDDATLGILKAFTVGDLLLNPVNELFNGADESYVEEIFVDTTVDGILYSVRYELLTTFFNKRTILDSEF